MQKVYIGFHHFYVRQHKRYRQVLTRIQLYGTVCSHYVFEQTLRLLISVCLFHLTNVISRHLKTDQISDLRHPFFCKRLMQSLSPLDGTGMVIFRVITGYPTAVENLKKKYPNKKMSSGAIKANRINL